MYFIITTLESGWALAGVIHLNYHLVPDISWTVDSVDTLELVDTGTQPRRSSRPNLPAAGRTESEPSPPASFSKKRILYVYFGSLGGGGGGQEAAAAAGTGHYIHVCQPGHCQPRCRRYVSL